MDGEAKRSCCLVRDLSYATNRQECSLTMRHDFNELWSELTEIVVC